MEASGLIATPLAATINQSFTTGHFPHDLKPALVSPLYKSGNKTSINNCRPVSVLITMSKIFKKLFAVSISTFLEDNQILHQNQYGFHPKYSTDLALKKFISNIITAWEHKNLVLSTNMDLVLSTYSIL